MNLNCRFSSITLAVALGAAVLFGMPAVSVQAQAPSAPRVVADEKSKDEQEVGGRLQAKYPTLQLLSVTRLLSGGEPVYEFLASGMVGYTNRGADFVLMGGNLIAGSGPTLVNVTEERAKSSATNLVRGLPTHLALKEVFGKGERTLVVFADPDCSYCQEFEKEIHDIGDRLNATVYTFIYPLVEVHPDADRKARHIACTAKPVDAWKDWMLNPGDWSAFAARHPAPASCPGAAQVDASARIGRALLIGGTPTLLFQNGMSLARKPTLEELEKSLDYIASHPEDVQPLTPRSGALR